MDIQIASNFERLIYDLNDCDDNETKKIMHGIKENGKYIIPRNKIEKINNDFLSASMSEQEILDIIKEVQVKYNTILDPHTAIGFGSLEKVNLEGNNIVLATAHPCKFPEAIDKSIGIKPDLPGGLKYIMDEKENYDIISNNLGKTQQYIKEKIQ
jgi:threonine synthase